MRKLYILLLSLVVALSSCTTMLETASTMDVTSSLNTAAVADLDVAPERITYTMTPQKAVRRGGLANIKRVAESEALEKNGGGDLLLNPECILTHTLASIPRWTMPSILNWIKTTTLKIGITNNTVTYIKKMMSTMQKILANNLMSD